MGQLDGWEMWFGVSKRLLVVLKRRKEGVCSRELSLGVLLGLVVLVVFLGVCKIGEIKAECVEIPL